MSKNTIFINAMSYDIMSIKYTERIYITVRFPSVSVFVNGIADQGSFVDFGIDYNLQLTLQLTFELTLD